MKVTVFQPEYPTDGDSKKAFRSIIGAMQSLPETDLAVFPEYCDSPSIDDAKSLAEFAATSRPELFASAAAAAQSGDCAVCFNAAAENRNTTFLLGNDGEIKGKYIKCHLTEAETGRLALDQNYPKRVSTVTYNGIRYAFLICYDVYFPELFARIAAQKPDVIILASYQRRETAEAARLQCRFLAYCANAFLVRASFSMGEKSTTGGNSMIISPEGEILAEMGQKVGFLSAEFDPHFKRTLKNPGLEWLSHRTPACYLPGGASVSRFESKLGYPRVCAHRGFLTAAPENTLPAFGAAIGAGADEIEFDIRVTADRQLVICHDQTLDRTTDISGKILDLPLETVRKADAGAKKAPCFAGTKIPLLREVFERFAGQTIFNMHFNLDITGLDFDRAFCDAVDLIYEYGCEDYVYIAGDGSTMQAAVRYAPEIARCCLDGQFDNTLIDNAVKYGCQKAQLYKPYFNDEMIQYAKQNGIKLNLFWSDDPDESKQIIASGIDTILSNDCMQIVRAIGKLSPLQLWNWRLLCTVGVT